MFATSPISPEERHPAAAVATIYAWCTSLLHDWNSGDFSQPGPSQWQFAPVCDRVLAFTAKTARQQPVRVPRPRTIRHGGEREEPCTDFTRKVGPLSCERVAGPIESEVVSHGRLGYALIELTRAFSHDLHGGYEGPRGASRPGLERRSKTMITLLLKFLALC